MRDSDRWITPRVIVAGMACVTVLLLAVIATVAWLTERRLDPEPMFKLVGVAVAALSSLGNFLVSLASRRTVAKTERNTGHLAGAVYDLADALPTRIPPIPPRHSHPETVEAPAYGAAPGGRGSE